MSRLFEMQVVPLKITIALTVAATLISGCTTLGGATAPTVLGGSVAAAPDLVRPLNGGLISRMEGFSIDRAMFSTALQAEYKALEYAAPGDISSWQSGDQRSAGQVVASQPYRVGSQDCRQYSHSFTQNGRSATAKGTACRNENGSWSLLD